MDKKPRIKISCKGAGTIDIGKLRDFQGDLKRLTPANREKLKNEILKDGFSEPLSIWNKGDKNYILNGHQRLKVLLDLRNEGYVVPEIPINFVKASSVNEAKRKLLALTSQFGSISFKGMKGYLKDTDLQIKDIADSFNFPEIQGEIEKALKPTKDDGGKIEFTHEILEEHNYVIFFFENSLDWGVVKQHFGLKPVKALDNSGNYRAGYKSVGVGRVISGKKLIEMIKKEGGD